MKRLVAAIVAWTVQISIALAQQPLDVEALKRRSAAGDRKATRALAEAHYAGSAGVAQDFARAAHYFEMLSKLGDVQALTTLGLMYARGIGVPKDVKEAVKKWRSAASRTHGADVGAEYNLAVTYLRGDDAVPANAKEALYWMKRAAENGHVLAQADLGVMYLEGAGIAPDDELGASWLIIAAERGDAGAQEKLKLHAERLTRETLDKAYARAKLGRKSAE